MNFLAKFYIKRGNKKVPLCLKHAKGEAELGSTEEIPAGSKINCEECLGDFLNK